MVFMLHSYKFMCDHSRISKGSLARTPLKFNLQPAHSRRLCSVPSRFLFSFRIPNYFLFLRHSSSSSSISLARGCLIPSLFAMVVSSGQVGRIISLGGITLLFVLFIHIYRSSGSSNFSGSSKFIRPKQGGSLKGIDPLLNDIQPPTGGKLYGPGEREHANATLLMLVRNSELKDALGSIGDLERTFNNKFKYPWTFINDEPFSEEFKEATRAVISGEARYGRRLTDLRTNR